MTADTMTRGPSIPTIVITTTSLGFVVVQLDVSIVNVALVRMGEALHSNVEGLQWVVDAYTLAFASLLLAAGAIGDRIGARRSFMLGLAIFTLSSLACGLAPDAALLIGARVAQGVGAALLMPSSLSLLNHASGNDQAARSRAIGLWTAAGGVALAAGPLIGGLLVDRLGWPSIFLINLPVGAAGIWLSWRFLDETESAETAHGFDWPGQALAILALFAFTGAVIEAGPLGWRTPLVLGGIGVAVAAGLGFILVEARSPAPMLPLRLFAKPNFSIAILVGLAVNLTVYGVIFVLGFYFQQRAALSTGRDGTRLPALHGSRDDLQRRRRPDRCRAWRAQADGERPPRRRHRLRAPDRRRCRHLLRVLDPQAALHPDRDRPRRAADDQRAARLASRRRNPAWRPAY